MHQQRVSLSRDHDYNTMSQDRLKSCFRREITSPNLPQVPAHVGLSQVLANNTLARPQSSFVKNRPVTQHQTSRPQVRAKSAHPRLLQANKYMHTNASTTQLQVGDKEQGIFTLSFWTAEFSRKILSNSSTNGGVGNVFMESKRNGRKRLTSHLIENERIASRFDPCCEIERGCTVPLIYLHFTCRVIPKTSLLSLITFCHTILMMMVRRIWYWIN